MYLYSKLLFGKYPRFNYSWEHFLKGLLHNITELNTWKWNSGKHEKGNSYLLCPVIFSLPGGWLIIMKKADMKKHENEIRALNGYNDHYYSKFISAGFGGDDKPDNYGYLNGKLVKVEYGS